MPFSANALREDNRFEDDEEIGRYRDNDRIAYHPSCSIGEAQRAEIVRAMDAYFVERGVDTAFFNYEFSDNATEDMMEWVIRDKGFAISLSQKLMDDLYNPNSDKEALRHTLEVRMDFANKDSLEEFKTYVANNEHHTAMTWEDLVAGLNKRFEDLGSAVRIDTAQFRSR